MEINNFIKEISSDEDKYLINRRITKITELDNGMTSYKHGDLKEKIVSQLAAVQYIVSFVLEILGEDFIKVIYKLDANGEFFYGRKNISLDNISKEFDGYLFLKMVEELKDSEGERLFGQYYTPENLVETIIELAEIDYESLHEKKLIDPSCGAGVFYLKIIDNLIEKQISFSNIIAIVTKSFWGYDIDAVSLFLTKLCICVHMKIKMYIPTIDIVKFCDNINSHFVNVNTLLEENCKFDYIIGNPPYFKMKDSVLIKKKYKKYIRGQANAYALFLIWALNNLKDNGKISFVIPQSIRNGRDFELIRKELMQYNINAIYLLDSKNRKKIFKNVEQAVMIITMQKSASSCLTKVITEIDNKVVESLYPQENIIFQEKFLIPSNKEVYQIISLLEKKTKFKNVEQNLIFGNGLFVWNQRKMDLINDDLSVPVIYGNYIKKNDFVFMPEKNNIVNGRKPFCRRNNNERFVYTGRRLLIKRTSSLENFERLKACLINEDFDVIYKDGYFVENHVNMLYCKNNKNEEINISKQLYILAYLCSDLANFYISQTNGNTQISANELNNLPYVVQGEEGIVKEMKKHDPDWQFINNHFYKIFKINSKQKQIILKCKEEK